MNLLPELTGATFNRYSLNIPSCSYPLDVEDFNGLLFISMSKLYFQVVSDCQTHL